MTVKRNIEFKLPKPPEGCEWVMLEKRGLLAPNPSNEILPGSIIHCEARFEVRVVPVIGLTFIASLNVGDRVCTESGEIYFRTTTRFICQSGDIIAAYFSEKKTWEFLVRIHGLSSETCKVYPSEKK